MTPFTITVRPIQHSNDFRIRFRRATTDEWTSVNPVLRQGEPAFDVTTFEFKIGDGCTPWVDLRTSSLVEMLAFMLLEG